MRWGAYIKRTAARRVVWILVGVAVYGLLGLFSDAWAQSANPCGPGHGCSRGEAFAASQNEQLLATLCLQTAHRVENIRREVISNRYQVDRDCIGYGSGGEERNFGNRRDAFYFVHCPVEAPWREDLGRCFDPSECSRRNQEEGYTQEVTRGWQSRCVAGCTLAFDSSQGRTCTRIGGEIVSCSGLLQYTGDQCDIPPGAPSEDDFSPADPPPQVCTPAGSGQSFCHKPNGDQCYTASSGRQICWRPNETGEKPDRDTLQKRDAGDTEIPPANPNLPTGDTLEKKGESITTTTTRTEGSNSSTTTTTTTNYGTSYGTSPKPGEGDAGEPGDGSGGAEGGEGDDEQGSVDGGGDCESPPIVSGGDPVVAAVVDQTWATRCAVEAGNSAKVTGDVADCKSPFIVEGTNANAVKLRAMREQICKEGERAENQGISDGLDAINNAMEDEFTVDDIWGDGSGDGGQGISTTRYGGGGSCPVIEVSIPVLGMTWTPPPFFCTAIAALRLLFLTVATIWALRVIGS